MSVDQPSVSRNEKNIESEFGSIEFKNFSLDLRQILIGTAIPFRRRNKNLVNSPVTTEVVGSFSRYDLMNSFLLDAGLRRLVARALRVRVRTIRDLADGAIFFGRTWNLNTPSAPYVDVPKLTNIEFDEQNRAIITGRAKVRASPESPIIESPFKIRTTLGTNGNGRYIKLVDTELAIVLECPSAWEKNINMAAEKLEIGAPPKPKPVVVFVPLGVAGKFRKEPENAGFDLGPDNCISEIWIANDALRFKLSATLRPGKFLSNNYLAFSVPIRTFIITRDRVRNGFRNARKNKAKVRERECWDVESRGPHF